MGKILAVVNQKGGVGKTTTTVNLTSALGELGKKCLLVDIDPQGNATSGLGADKRKIAVTAYELFIGTAQPEEAVLHTAYRNVDLIPSGIRLAGAEIEMVELERREYRLKHLLKTIEGDFDFLFVDCPPSLGLLTVNALTAAQRVLIPIQCEYYALEGVSSLMNTVNRVKHAFNPGLDIEGVLLTMFDGRTNLALQVAEEVKHYFPGKVFATVIPRNVRLSEAPSHGLPGIIYDPKSRGAVEYQALADEFLTRQE